MPVDLDALMTAYREEVIIPALVANVKRAYIVGDLLGQRRVHAALPRALAHAKERVDWIKTGGFTLRFDLVSKEALDYLETYQNDLAHGGTWIGGKFVRWLENHSGEVREAIANTLDESVREGWGRDELVRKLGETMDGERWKLQRIAQTESMRIQRAGMVRRYADAGVPKVRRLLGANPCPECEADADGVYNIDEVPEDHVQGHCDFAPIITVEPDASALMPEKEIDRLLDVCDL